MTMSTRNAGLLTLLAVLAMPVAADPIVRSAAELEQLPIQGITLAMTPREAFETLLAAGFRAGDLDGYDDWESDGVEFVRGEYGSPGGHSSVQFSRQGDRIVSISETFNAPGSPIDAVAAIGAVRSQLNIPSDNPMCRTAGDHAGVCEVRDAELGSEASVIFTLQIGAVMRLVSVSRSRELAVR
jgi:hypothetical protein